MLDNVMLTFDQEGKLELTIALGLFEYLKCLPDKLKEIIMAYNMVMRAVNKVFDDVKRAFEGGCFDDATTQKISFKISKVSVLLPTKEQMSRESNSMANLGQMLHQLQKGATSEIFSEQN